MPDARNNGIPMTVEMPNQPSSVPEVDETLTDDSQPTTKVSSRRRIIKALKRLIEELDISAVATRNSYILLISHVI